MFCSSRHWGVGSQLHFSKLASWLIERGSATLEKSGEVGLAQQGAAIQFHKHLSFRLRFVNSNLGTFEILTLSATIINDLRIDVILGLCGAYIRIIPPNEYYYYPGGGGADTLPVIEPFA